MVVVGLQDTKFGVTGLEEGLVQFVKVYLQQVVHAHDGRQVGVWRFVFGWREGSLSRLRGLAVVWGRCRRPPGGWLSRHRHSFKIVHCRLEAIMRCCYPVVG